MGHALFLRGKPRPSNDNPLIAPDLLRHLAQEAEEGRFAREFLRRLLDEADLDETESGTVLILPVGDGRLHDLAAFAAFDEDSECSDAVEEIDPAEDDGLVEDGGLYEDDGTAEPDHRDDFGLGALRAAILKSKAALAV